MIFTIQTDKTNNNGKHFGLRQER